MDTDLWGLFLIVLAGFLAGGAYAMWGINRTIGIGLAGCTALSVVYGALRLSYF